MKKIKFGIIGCSAIAERIVIPAILKAKNSELEFIGSRSEGKAKKFAKKFSCRNYGSYKEVLERKDIDAVYISLPIALQEKIVLDSAKARKHILCEKSVTTSFHSAEKIIQSCEKNNVHILEGFSFIYHPQQQKVLEYIKNNKIGTVFSFIGKYGFVLPYSKKDFRFKKELGGGVLNDVGCYLIKTSRMIFKTNPISVNCNLYLKKKNGIDLKGSVYMRFPNNRISVGLFSYLDSFQSKYELWGEKGIISLERAFNAKMFVYVPEVEIAGYKRWFYWFVKGNIVVVLNGATNGLTPKLPYPRDTSYTLWHNTGLSVRDVTERGRELIFTP